MIVLTLVLQDTTKTPKTVKLVFFLAKHVRQLMLASPACKEHTSMLKLRLAFLVVRLMHILTLWLKPAKCALHLVLHAVAQLIVLVA